MNTSKIIPIRIISTGIHLPGDPVHSADLEKKHNKPENWTNLHSGVVTRHWIGPEDTCTSMGFSALKNALVNAGLIYEDLDLVVSASASYDYPIPHNACLIQEKFESDKNVPGFDIDATCLGFIVALDVCSKLLDGKRYKKIAIVCSEFSSMHLNPEDWETYSLLGDGAFACILGESENEEQGVIHADLKTYPQAAQYNMVQMGGCAYPFHLNPIDDKRFFRMEGKKLLRMAHETIVPFFDNFFENSEVKLNEVDKLIPHQASLPGLKLSEKILGLEEGKMYINIQEYGNTLSCSAGIALHEAVSKGEVKRGDTIFIVGTGAGFSLGGVLINY